MDGEQKKVLHKKLWWIFQAFEKHDILTGPFNLRAHNSIIAGWKNNFCAGSFFFHGWNFFLYAFLQAMAFSSAFCRTENHVPLTLDDSFFQGIIGNIWGGFANKTILNK